MGDARQDKIEHAPRRKFYPFMSGQERLAVWEKARGIWKDRQPDPIKELEQMRKEWDRDLPPLRD